MFFSSLINMVFWGKKYYYLKITSLNKILVFLFFVKNKTDQNIEQRLSEVMIQRTLYP